MPSANDGSKPQARGRPCASGKVLPNGTTSLAQRKLIKNFRWIVGFLLTINFMVRVRACESTGARAGGRVGVRVHVMCVCTS